MLVIFGWNTRSRSHSSEGLSMLANWWAPAPLRRLHERIGLRASDAGRRGG
jgi:hypothetical protein